MPNNLTRKKEYYLAAFLLAFFMAAAFFLPYIIYDKGYFLFFGDFNAQQVPFYKLAHAAVREGGIFWSWNTDLGANFIGSYSFYLLGSPFFWLTLPFPNDFVPYLMGPLLILKFALASLFAYAYFTRFTKNPKYALLGAILYAFSGFSLYNVFFNHFHESIVFFPLLLLALEKFFVDSRRGFVFPMIFLCAVSNYFFFAGMAFFLVIYFIIRLMSREWWLTWSRFFALSFELILGVALGAALLFPAVMEVLQNSRVSRLSINDEYNALFFGRPQKYGAIIQSFFFMPDLPSRPVFFSDDGVKWTSAAGYLPVFSMVGVISFLAAKKGHWLRRVILTLSVVAFVPLFNSAFFMMNSAYYARWFYIPTLMMALATVLSLEDSEVRLGFGLKWSVAVTGAFIVLIGLLPAKAEDESVLIGLYNKEYGAAFWIYCGLAVACLVITGCLLRLRVAEERSFFRYSIAAVTIFSVLMCGSYIGFGKAHSYNAREFIIPHAINGAKNIDLPDDQFYRIDIHGTADNLNMDNLPMYWGKPSIQAFHSIVPASVFDFYDSIGVRRTVGSRADETHVPLRALTSARYIFDRVDQKTDNAFGDITKPADTYKMQGYKYFDTQNGFHIFENQNYIPFGFCYDKYLTRSDYETLTGSRRETVMLKCAVLEDSVIFESPGERTKLTKLIEPLDLDCAGGYGFLDATEDCAKLKKTVCDSVATGRRGFTAHIKPDSPRLCFFSVPYADGWTAAINGQETEIFKTNVGFMSVLCGEGDNSIRFRYMPPGLVLGSWISIGAAVLMVTYVVMLIVFRPKSGRKSKIKPVLFEEIEEPLIDAED